MSIKLNFAHDEPEFRRPVLLQHPTIPERLFGVNPRVINGQEWWDRVRKVAYEKNNFCCWACGVHKSEDRFHQWLEAHEWFDYNTATCIVTLREIVALCPTCHMFIHIGNTHRRYASTGELSALDVRHVIAHGVETLRTAKLKPLWGPIHIAEGVFNSSERKGLGIKNLSKKALKAAGKMLDCDHKWKLLYEGKYYWRDRNGSVIEVAKDD